MYGNRLSNIGRYMKRYLKIILFGFIHLVIFFLLTLITQTGGVIYLFSLILFLLISKKFVNRYYRFTFRLVLFVTLYTIISVFIVPPLAAKFGRVPLSIRKHPNLKPLVAFTYLCNRHYVSPEMKKTIEGAADYMANKYPTTKTYYLDANFPFFNGYRLWPHLSHNDGKKLDLAYYYTNKAGAFQFGSPSFIGYGVSIDPLPGETNQPAKCKQSGYWQYGLMSGIVSQGKKKDYIFDSERSRELLDYFAQNKRIEKIFIEPHLKQRLHLTDTKFRLHGCKTVRHDDHIHIQVK